MKILSTSIFFAFFVLQQLHAQISITRNAANGTIELRNGKRGVIIPAFNEVQRKASKTLAPIQSLIYANGQLSDKTPNYLATAVRYRDVKVDVKQFGDSAIRASVQYLFDKPLYKFWSETYKGGEPGKGSVTYSFYLHRKYKSVFVEVEGDFEAEFDLDIFQNLEPDKARYRGWASSAREFGYEPDGKIYRQEYDRTPMDAQVDLDYSKETLFPYLNFWEVAGGEWNTGRYWQLFKENAPSSSNMLGIYQGRPSRLVGAKGSGVQLRVIPEKQSLKDSLSRSKLTLYISLYRRSADNQFYPRKRFEFALYLGTRQDVLPAGMNQPIMVEMNRYSHLGERVHRYANTPVRLDPSVYNGSIYLPADKIAGLISRFKGDKNFTENYLQIDPYFKPIADAWRFPDSARSEVRRLIEYRDWLLQEYVQGNGTHAPDLKYWKGAYNFKNTALRIICIFSDKSIALRADEKKSLEQLIGLMGRIVWDPDNVPFDIASGVNLGNANMLYQYQNNGRSFFAMLLAPDPEFSERAREVARQTVQDLHNTIYQNGSSIANPHYAQAALDPILYSILQLRQAGVADLMKQESEKINNLTQFFLSLLTPPSVRFSGYRKLVSFGDGPEESAVTFGLLSNLYQGVDEKMSALLAGIFQHGAPRLSIFGYLCLTVNLDPQPIPRPDIRASFFPGYLSHFRSGVNTENESAVWILNGDSLFDHRHDDAGQLAIYALKAPLSLNWSSFYAPQVSDARYKATLVPLKKYPAWNTGGVKFNERSLTNRSWSSSVPVGFATHEYGSSTRVLMKDGDDQWTRTVTLLSFAKEMPVFIVFDSVGNNQPCVWTMPFFSTGPVQTSFGVLRSDPVVYSSEMAALASPGMTLPMTRGWNSMKFTGQSWPAALHASGGINWTLHSYVNSDCSSNLTEWTNTWQNSQEMAEYRKSMGTEYRETQQILRIKGSGPFFQVILPERKGAASKPVVRYKARVISIMMDDTRMELAPEFLYCKDNTRTVLMSLTQGSFVQDAYEISGDGMELIVEKDELFVHVGGQDNVKKFRVPGNYALADKQDNGVTTRFADGFTYVSITHRGGGQQGRKYRFIKR